MSSVAFFCHHCTKTFTRNSSLRRHVKQCHDAVELPSSLKRGRSARADTRMLTCAVCDASFSHRSSLSRHTKTTHDQRSTAAAAQPHRRSEVQKMEFCDIAGVNVQLKFVLSHYSIILYSCCSSSHNSAERIAHNVNVFIDS